MPRTLLFASHYVGMGGGESVQLSLMAELIARGYRLHLLTPRAGTFVSAAVALGVQTHTLPFRGASTYFIPAVYTRWPVVGRMASVLRQITPDLIHSDYHTLPYSVGAGERVGVPVLWNAMGGWFGIKAWQRAFFSQRVWHCMAITASVRRDLLGPHPFMPPDRMPVLMPGVDPVRFAPNVVSGEVIRARIGIDATTPLVSLIGRFQHVKGQDVFLDMARRIAVELPAARFALSGDNVFGVAADERFKRQIVKTVEADPMLRERVTFLGFWPDSREVMAASDVIVCSSRFESLGMAVIEAMAMGRPVVSTRVGGPSETVLDGETGYLVDSGDAEAFARRVMTLLADPDLRAQIGTAARRHVESTLTVRRYADQFVALIESGLSG
ncbi:MAG: glycosyltransferase family 4 protein [Aggregatilineales bacterium]